VSVNYSSDRNDAREKRVNQHVPTYRLRYLFGLGCIIVSGSIISFTGLYLVLDLGHSGPRRSGLRVWLGWGVVGVALALTGLATASLLAHASAP